MPKESDSYFLKVTLKLLYTGPGVYLVSCMYSLLDIFRALSSSTLSFASFKLKFNFRARPE